MDDMSGLEFGRLTVLRRGTKKSKGELHWICLCECGNESEVRGGYLRRGISKSCGCLKEPHGMTMTPEWRSWREMLARCRNPNNGRYADYGGRGIKVCERWLVFEHFYADMGSRPDGMTLDRADSNGDYFKDNCRWATRSEQQRNRRDSALWSIHGAIYDTAGDAAKALGKPVPTIRGWVRDGRSECFRIPKYSK